MIAAGISWAAIAVGFAAACLALYGRYRKLPAVFTGPDICRQEAGGCQILFRSRGAALLGVPNSLLGILFYPAVAAGLLLGWPAWWLFSAASAALAMTVALALRLVRRRLECRICWAGHAANAVLWGILGARLLPG